MAEHVGRYGVRKGAWSEQEDVLLKECVEKYGEGKWHQVPIKSGLNRCRKSCRLRWLNYLKPNIKRGEFSSDEADLMIRLHRLLGNRWSLIAGRLPGRTANDVKNYWNTHLRKKAMICLQVKSHPRKSHVSADHLTKVIRPRPRIFSKSLVNCMMQQQQQGQGQQQKKAVDDKVELVTDSSALVSSEDVDDQIQWWKSLLNDETDQFTQHEKSMTLGSLSNLEQQGYGITFANDNINDGAESVDKLCMEYEERPACYGELSFNIDLWDFLSDEW